MLCHVGQDAEAALGAVEVAVLDTGLDDIERGRDNERGRCTSNRGDEVLEPGGLVVVLETEDELLGESGTTEEGERARGVSGCGPTPSAVETETLILDDLEHTTAAEGLGVGLALDLENVKREEDDLADTDQTTGKRVHDGLTCLLAEGILEVLAVVLPEEVARNGLATVLVYSLEDLVPGSALEHTRLFLGNIFLTL